MANRKKSQQLQVHEGGRGKKKKQTGAPSCSLEPPPELEGQVLLRFQVLVADLVADGVRLPRSARYPLARLAGMQVERDALLTALTKDGLEGRTGRNPALSRLQRLDAEMFKIERTFGMTPHDNQTLDLDSVQRDESAQDEIEAAISQ